MGVNGGGGRVKGKMGGSGLVTEGLVGSVWTVSVSKEAICRSEQVRDTIWPRGSSDSCAEHRMKGSRVESARLLQ